MSDIPRARAILKKSLNEIQLALSLLDREKPAFRADTYIPPLSPERKQRARELRKRGWAIQRIADKLGTNQGRVSEAVNEGRRK